jgi:sensor histidine kinase YesM
MEAARLREEAVGLEARLADARLHALRMQMNPHFLFNTLHAVSSLVERDPVGVRRMIARLSELLRYTLEGSGSQEVTLREELDFLRRYLEIQQIRFQGRLDVMEFIDEDTLDAQLPSMILQPLVENAVKHGVNMIEGSGRIELRARQVDGMLVVSIHDNGPGIEALPPEPLSSSDGVGLRNTRERLEMLYGGGDRLSLEQSPLGGLIAKIRVPFHTSRDLRTSLVEAPA